MHVAAATAANDRFFLLCFCASVASIEMHEPIDRGLVPILIRFFLFSRIREFGVRTAEKNRTFVQKK